MAITPLEQDPGTLASLDRVRVDLASRAGSFVAGMDQMSTRELAATVAAVEDISKIVEFFQLAGAWAVERADVARVGERDGLFGGPVAADCRGAESSPGGGIVPAAGADTGERGWADPAEALNAGTGRDGSDGQGAAEGEDGSARRGTEFRTNAEYLRARLGIGAGEAKRRIRVGQAALAGRLPSGEPGSVRLPVLGKALAEGRIAGRAASLITDAVARVRPAAGMETAAEMEAALVRQAVEADQDVLGKVARMWEAAADADGSEPSEAALRAKQGVFYRGRRGGLHYFTLAADDAQYPALATVMNTATNPRLTGENITAGNGTGMAAGTTVEGDGEVPGTAAFLPAPASGTTDAVFGDGTTDQDAALLDPRSFAQKQLAGLVAGCVVALSAGRLPATGGHRAQIMVTTGYKELAGKLTGPAHPVFGHPVSAKTVRRLACDASIIPVVLGSQSEVLDLGRASRFFTPAVRKALAVRDCGCAFPGCTMPAVWCEAHHVVPWYRGGRTNVNNGVLLCIFHHDLVEQGDWEIAVEDGIPWFIPPGYVDPHRRRRRNRYWRTKVPDLLPVP
ncbi:DUF222 domain-containing protein [Arthrobacter sp. NPDC055138]